MVVFDLQRLLVCPAGNSSLPRFFFSGSDPSRENFGIHKQPCRADFFIDPQKIRAGKNKKLNHSFFVETSRNSVKKILPWGCQKRTAAQG